MERSDAAAGLHNALIEKVNMEQYQIRKEEALEARRWKSSQVIDSDYSIGMCHSMYRANYDTFHTCT